MKAPPSTHQAASDDDNNDNNDNEFRTSTHALRRPHLKKSPPERLSEVLYTPPNTDTTPRLPREAALTVEYHAPEIGRGKSEAEGGIKHSQAHDALRGEDERLAKLRQAMSVKLAKQHRLRRSYGSTNPDDSSSARVAAIREEESVTSPPHSSTTTAAMPSRTNSTESAGSTSTVRAGTAPASHHHDLPPRTPSYPFPYVSPASQRWMARVHQPFTALSPTGTAGPSLDEETLGDGSGVRSGETTPMHAANAFLPPGAANTSVDDPRFPTPNLYDLVLKLNAEPGMEQWWSIVANLLHDHFRADRATISLPRDSSDIENVPWGQKATFSMKGVDNAMPLGALEQAYSDVDRPRSTSKVEAWGMDPFDDDVRRQGLHPERFRPRLEARHSYAGHGKEAKDKLREIRPPPPQRTATHAAGMTLNSAVHRMPTLRSDSMSTQQQSSLGNPEFSSSGGDLEPGPYAAVFPMLRDLEHEMRPLIDSGGINRVLDRGQAVTVTRDYLSTDAPMEDNTRGRRSWVATPVVTPRPSVVNSLGILGNISVSNSPSSVSKDYEEYEQYPCSPWSQSPAPSPAIQSDEDENPFFAAKDQHVEDSFNPSASPKDYSQLGPVEAIGVDHASTVIHIPLVHPTLSQPMQSENVQAKMQKRSDAPHMSNPFDAERRSPIAILSVLTSMVPYPRNLVQSLRLLGPHLATSFAISQQFSSTRRQAVAIRPRRTETGHVVTTAPLMIVPSSMQDLFDSGIVGNFESGSGSMTSRSDHSGRSPYSSTSSIVGTPGWDPANHGWVTNKPSAPTPALTGSEMVDSYFEAKKRSSKRSASNGSVQPQTTPALSSKKAPAPGSEVKPGTRKPSPTTDSPKTAYTNQKTRGDVLSKTDQSNRRDASPPQSPQRTSSLRFQSRHSMAFESEPSGEKRTKPLQSHITNVGASVGGLPSSTVDDVPTPGVFGHTRNLSNPDGMPAPSERLLRTIIDSVPVQIFTAEPGTGKLTWVNAKFTVYRAQSESEVLADPWQSIHPEDRDEFMAIWQRSLRTAQQLQQKIRLQRFDGGYRWFYVRAAPLRDKKQKIVYWMGTMMDFHDQHLAQETAAKQHETAASEAKYRALANSSPQIVFAVNKTKGIIFCNTQWVQYSGQEEKQARGVGFMDHVHPDDLAKCKLPTFDEHSDVPKGVPTSVPPELKRATSASVESSSGSSETERVVSSPIASPSTTPMPQRKLSELATTGILKVSRDAEGRPSYSTEVRLKSKDGVFRWHLVRVLLAEPFLQKQEGEGTWYGTCTDISDHKALERDLKETMDEKSRFLSNMSHEIRTPLNGITGMVNFLIDSNLTAEQMEHVSIIRNSTEGLRGLINDILDLSKAEAGMIQLNMDWLYVPALLEEVNDLTSTMAIDKGIELNYLVEEDIPTQIKGDRFRIRQILLNVVGNAIKFTQKGEVFIHCSTRPTVNENLAENELYIKFEVIDTGRGFTNAEAEYLFKRFSQIDGSSTRQHGGTGLGLVISKQLAQLHGGDMLAKGEAGKGSTFTCIIKATLPSAVDEPPTPLLTPGGVDIPILPVQPGAAHGHIIAHALPVAGDAYPGHTLRFVSEQTQSPSPYASPLEPGRESPAASSASSDPSLISTTRSSSIRSARSSASSFMPDIVSTGLQMKLALPGDSKTYGGSKLSRSTAVDSPPSSWTSGNARKGSIASVSSNTVPPMYSILVVCPLQYSRQATVHHIDKTLPKNVPHQITSEESLLACQKLISGGDPVIFTHIVVVLHNVSEIATLMDQVLISQAHQSTSIVVISDLNQKRRIIEHAPHHDYERLRSERRLLFVFKPLKPSRFATIFDPQKERETSLDRNQDSAHQVAFTQKQVFEEVAKRLGKRDKRVLLVEDNKTNQLVVKKFLAKVSIDVDTAIDGIECTEKVFSRPFGHYSIILCDLHMPNKDGYQTCLEIRKWERENRYPHLPIVALSANVLGDVHEKCVASGFSSYLSKPVDFKELGTVLVAFMDPHDPNKPHEFMKAKGKRVKGAIGS